MSDGPVHPILANTDALIAYARLDCWKTIFIQVPDTIDQDEGDTITL